jgi:hypothetical protein
MGKATEALKKQKHRFTHFRDHWEREVNRLTSELQAARDRMLLCQGAAESVDDVINNLGPDDDTVAAAPPLPPESSVASPIPPPELAQQPA